MLRGSFILFGVRAEDQGVGGGATEVIWRNPVRVEAGICEGFRRDLGDRRIAVAPRKRVDNALLSLIASLAIAVKQGSEKSGLSSAKTSVTKTVSSAGGRPLLGLG